MSLSQRSQLIHGSVGTHVQAVHSRTLTLSSRNRFLQEAEVLAGTPDLHITPNWVQQGPPSSSEPACFHGPDLEGVLLKGAQAGRCSWGKVWSADPVLPPFPSWKPSFSGTPALQLPLQLHPLPNSCSRLPPRQLCCRAREETFFMLCLFPSQLSCGPDRDLFPAHSSWHLEQGGLREALMGRNG